MNGAWDGGTGKGGGHVAPVADGSGWQLFCFCKLGLGSVFFLCWPVVKKQNPRQKTRYQSRLYWLPQETPGRGVPKMRGWLGGLETALAVGGFFFF